MSVDEIEGRLREALAAEHVAVEDESRFHAGHGATGGHFRAVVVSARFVGLSRVAVTAMFTVHQPFALDLGMEKLRAFFVAYTSMYRQDSQ